MGQSGRVLSDPNASRGDKLMAGLNIGLGVIFEAGEPDDILPVGLPLDDVGRRALMKTLREAYEEGGEEAVERVLRDTLGDQADDVLQQLSGLGAEIGEEGFEDILRVGNIEIPSYAQERMFQRGVTLDDMEYILRPRNAFEYFHDGVKKIGYYDSEIGVFVGTIDGRVTTVIDDVSEQY